MLCTPFRKAKEDDLMTRTQRYLTNSVEMVVDADNKCDYSAAIVAATKVIQHANALADLQANENN